MEPVRRVEGPVQVLDRSDVDTDQIIPKQYLKRIERTGFGEFLFSDWRKEGLELDPERPILVTERNFGCGSSREHAVWALQDFGFRAVVAPSFADIFYGNCTKTGLLPVVLAPEEVRMLMQAERATIDLERQTVEWEGGSATFDIDPETRRRFLEGLDEIALTLRHTDDIDRFEEAGRPGGSLTTSVSGAGR
jgi:3-isopropylmalate/(R)-2-methylmalate dehydratase small subunit